MLGGVPCEAPQPPRAGSVGAGLPPPAPPPPGACSPVIHSSAVRWWCRAHPSGASISCTAEVVGGTRMAAANPRGGADPPLLEVAQHQRRQLRPRAQSQHAAQGQQRQPVQLQQHQAEQVQPAKRPRGRPCIVAAVPAAGAHQLASEQQRDDSPVAQQRAGQMQQEQPRPVQSPMQLPLSPSAATQLASERQQDDPPGAQQLAGQMQQERPRSWQAAVQLPLSPAGAALQDNLPQQKRVRWADGGAEPQPQRHSGHEPEGEQQAQLAVSRADAYCCCSSAKSFVSAPAPLLRGRGRQLCSNSMSNDKPPYSLCLLCCTTRPTLLALASACSPLPCACSAMLVDQRTTVMQSTSMGLRHHGRKHLWSLQVPPAVAAPAPAERPACTVAAAAAMAADTLVPRKPAGNWWRQVSNDAQCLA